MQDKRLVVRQQQWLDTVVDINEQVHLTVTKPQARRT